MKDSVILNKVSEAEANTWVATDYWTQYGSKVGITDEYYDEPIHVVLAMFITNSILASDDNTFQIPEANVGGVTIKEFRENGSLYCERRLYLVVREDK